MWCLYYTAIAFHLSLFFHFYYPFSFSVSSTFAYVHCLFVSFFIYFSLFFYYRIYFIFCWPCISLQILGKNQLDTLFHVCIYFMSLHVSSVTTLIIRRSNYINASSGMISLCKCCLVCRSGGFLPDRHTKQSLTQTNHTRWYINTIRSPDDERCDARNM